MIFWSSSQIHRQLKRVKRCWDRWKVCLARTLLLHHCVMILLFIMKNTERIFWQVRPWLSLIPVPLLWKFIDEFLRFGRNGRKKSALLWPAATMIRRIGRRLSVQKPIRKSLPESLRIIMIRWKLRLLWICGWQALMFRLLQQCMYTSLCMDTIWCRQLPVWIVFSKIRKAGWLLIM